MPIWQTPKLQLPAAQNQYMQEKVLVEFILREYRGGLQFELARTQETVQTIFEEWFSKCFVPSQEDPKIEKFQGFCPGLKFSSENEIFKRE